MTSSTMSNSVSQFMGDLLVGEGEPEKLARVLNAEPGKLVHILKGETKLILNNFLIKILRTRNFSDQCNC